MWPKFYENPVIHALIIFLLIIGVTLLSAWIFSPVLLPLIISGILYVVLEPLVVILEGRGFNDKTAVAFVIIFLLLIIFGSVVTLFPLLFDQLQELQERLPHLWQKISSLINVFSTIINDVTGVKFDADTVFQNALNYFKSTGATLVISSASILMQFAMALFLVPLITYFLLRDFRVLRNRMMSWLPNHSFELGWIIYHAVVLQLQDYLRGVMKQSTIIALIASLGFYLIDVEMYFLFGVLTGLLNFIPYVGPLLAVIPPLLVALGGESVTMLTLVGIPLVVLSAQLVDNVLVIPTLIAHTVNLHPLVVLLGIIIFGAFLGFIGMLIAIPIMAISKIVFTSLLYGLNKQDTYSNH